jgi:hypothetical protein
MRIGRPERRCWYQPESESTWAKKKKERRKSQVSKSRWKSKAAQPASISLQIYPSIPIAMQFFFFEFAN